MKENPASSMELKLAAESVPASATTTRFLTSWRSWEAFNTGTIVVVSAIGIPPACGESLRTCGPQRGTRLGRRASRPRPEDRSGVPWTYPPGATRPRPQSRGARSSRHRARTPSVPLPVETWAQAAVVTTRPRRPRPSAGPTMGWRAAFHRTRSSRRPWPARAGGAFHGQIEHLLARGAPAHRGAQQQF